MKNKTGKLPVIITDESKVTYYGLRGIFAKNNMLKIKSCAGSIGER